MKKIELTVTPKAGDGMRIDRYIADVEAIVTRNQFKRRVDCILVNDSVVKPSRIIRTGDRVVVMLNDPAPEEYVPEKMDLAIIYEDKNVMVVDKPQGMVVHPAPGHHSGTLAQGIRYYIEGISDLFEGDDQRPGIVHRLDKDTSGVLIIAKNPTAHEFLSQQFRDKQVRKTYLAIVRGVINTRHGTIEGRLIRDPRNRKKYMVSDERGKASITHYKLLQTYGGYSFVACHPRTGRTHQLRVHLKHIGHSILGDPIYGQNDKRVGPVTLMLHAYRLQITLPGEDTPRVFHSPLPERFKSLLQELYVIRD